MAEAGKRADADVLRLIQGDSPHSVDAVDGDQLLAGPLAFPHLHQHVSTTGNDLGLGVLQTQTDGVLDTLRLIQCFQIIHGLYSS